MAEGNAPDSNRAEGAKPERGMRYEVFGNTLAISTPGCTCSPVDHYGHEQYCGLEPVIIGLSEDEDKMKAVASELNWLLDHLFPEEGS